MIISLRSVRFKEEAHIPGQTAKGGIGSPFKVPEDHRLSFDTVLQVVVLERHDNSVPPTLVPMGNVKEMIVEPEDGDDTDWLRSLREDAAERGRALASVLARRADAKAQADADAKALAELEAEEASARAAAKAADATAATSPETPSARTLVVAKDAKTGKAKGKLDVGDPEAD